MNRYTSGPWAVLTELDGDGDTVRVVVPGKNFHVALVYGHGGDAQTDMERNANARLIAAAPEMLSAMKFIASTLKKFSNGETSRLVVDAALDEAGVVLKRIEG